MSQGGFAWTSRARRCFHAEMKTIIGVLVLFWSFVGHAAEAIDGYQYFTHDGVRIAYRIFGSGAPLFLLNGGPGRSSDTFVPLARRLQAETHRQIIVFDQRGTGRSKLSEMNEKTVSLELMVSDLEALREHLGLAKISLMGHSFGGMYAMAYAVQYPGKIEALILSCSGGMDLSWQQYTQHNMLSRLTEKARQRYAYWTSEEQEKKDPIRASREATKLLVPAYIYRQKFVPRLMKDLTNPKYGNSQINKLVWLSMRDYDLKEPLKSLQVPTLILGGRQDILGEQVPISIHQTIAHSRLELIDECSHYPWLDSPERYFELIRGFLK